MSIGPDGTDPALTDHAGRSGAGPGTHVSANESLASEDALSLCRVPFLADDCRPGDPAEKVAGVLGGGLRVVVSHRHQTSDPAFRNFDTFVLRGSGGSGDEPGPAYVAILHVDPAPDGVEPAAETQTLTLAPAPASTSTRSGSATTASVLAALSTAITGVTLVDLLEKLQQRGDVWPTVGGVALPNSALCYPRLALCRAVLASTEADVGALRTLVGLDGFRGRSTAGHLRLQDRLAWHLAYESTVCRANHVQERMTRWRSTLPDRIADALVSTKAHSGVRPAAAAMASRTAMLSNPPLGTDGFIETGFMLNELDEWLASVRATALR